MQKDQSLSVVTCAIDFCFPPEKIEQGLRLLLSSVGFIESKTGCQACSVARDALDVSKVCYKETWSSEPVFRRHAQSAEFRRVLIAMDMCCEKPNVVIGNFSGHSGLAYLQRLCIRPASND